MTDKERRIGILCRAAWRFARADLTVIGLTQKEMDEITGSEGLLVTQYLNPVTASLIPVKLLPA